MHKNNILSIVIPVYNQKDCVINAINSVLKQLEFDTELIVIDDGSNDGTEDVLAAIKPNKNIVIHHFKENRGVNAARNSGVRLAQGKYILFLDSDDVLIDKSLNKMLSVLRTNDVVEHLWFVFLDDKSMKIQKLEAFCIRYASKVIVISEGLRSYIKDTLHIYKELYLIPNGVDVDQFSTNKSTQRLNREDYGFDKDSILIGYIGSIRKMEGLDIAIQAMEQLHSKNSNIHLVIIGDGGERKALEILTKKIGATQYVHFFGQVSHEKVKEFYDMINVLIFPRAKSVVTDTVTPLKPLEAMAMGKVVIASDVGGLKELVKVKECLFKAGDIKSFSECVLKCTQNFGLSQLSTVERNLSFVKERDWSIVCSAYKDIYAMSI